MSCGRGTLGVRVGFVTVGALGGEVYCVRVRISSCSLSCLPRSQAVCVSVLFRRLIIAT
jgi:hypothetical protein